MKIIVKVHPLNERGSIDSGNPVCEIEDPSAREDLTIQDSWKIHRHIKDAVLRDGLGVFVVSGDPGADTGRLLVVQVEVPHAVTYLDPAVQRIKQYAVDAFSQL